MMNHPKGQSPVQPKEDSLSIVKGHIINRGKKNKKGKPNWGFVAEAGYDEQGKRKRVWRSGFASKRDAEEALILHLAKLIEEKNRTRTAYRRRLSKAQLRRIALSTFLRNWLGTREKEVSSATAELERWLVEKHIIPVLGVIPLYSLTEKHIEELYEAKAAYSVNTRERIHRVLRTALEDANEQNLIEWNPCSSTLRPTKERRPTYAKSVEELFGKGWGLDEETR